MSTTIKGRRLELGLSREQLAERVGVTERAVERWEEVGLNADPMSTFGDYLLDKITRALQVEEGLLVDFVPDSPKPGDFVVSPRPGVGIVEFLDRLEDLDVRIVVPDEWGQTLKKPADATDEDYAAIYEHFATEVAHAFEVSGKLKNAVELLGGETGAWKKGQTMAERIEEVARETVDELQRTEDE